MKRIALFVLTVLTVAALALAFSPASVKADTGVFPIGTYTTTITAEDVAKYGLPSPYPELLIGDWELTFRANEVVDVANLSTGQSAHGMYMANPVMLIWEGKETGELACMHPGNAAYKWSAGEDTLIFTGASEQNDRCWGRYIVSTSHPLVKQP